MVNQWPASFMMKRDVPGRGELKLMVRYEMSVYLLQVGNGQSGSNPGPGILTMNQQPPGGPNPL
jgi:hypothetical protein